MIQIPEDWKIQPVEPCTKVNTAPADPLMFEAAVKAAPWMTPSKERVVTYALEQLERYRAEDEARHARNEPALAMNRRIADALDAIMTQLGVAKTYTTRDLKSRARTPRFLTVTAGYREDIARLIVLDDAFGRATQVYQERKVRYEAELAKAQRADQDRAAETQRQQEQERRKREADLAFVRIVDRYRIDLHATWAEVLDELCKLNQRVDLAVAMAQTRGDWSDGFYRVEHALARFDVQTTEDQDIADAIGDALHGDESDGRIFRDMHWSYDRLFQAAGDAQLVADAQTAMGYDHS